MSTISLTIDGRVVPLAQCEWVLWATCGCPLSCMYADKSPHAVIVTEEQAWTAFYDYDGKRALTRDRSAGYRVELMTRKRYGEQVLPLMLRTECPHR